MPHKNVKNIKFVAIRCVLAGSNCIKSRFWPRFCPGPRWGSLRALYKPPSRMEEHLQRLDLGAYGASILRPHPNNISGYTLMCQRRRNGIVCSIRPP